MAIAIGVAVIVVVAAVLVLAYWGSTSSSTGCPSSGCSPSLSVASFAGAVNNTPTIQPSPVRVPADSLVFVFVSYVNALVGGGEPQWVNDSVGDSYALVTTTALELNHTESLYVTAVAESVSSLTVSVTFIGGRTPQGGSVAVVVVAGAVDEAIDGERQSIGTGAVASVSLPTEHTGDLCVLGVAGRGVSAPFTAASGETLLNTGAGTSGPFEDGTGYGTFSTVGPTSSTVLSAHLNTPTGWDAIGVAVD
jgi:hypothetical protein